MLGGVGEGTVATGVRAVIEMACRLQTNYLILTKTLQLLGYFLHDPIPVIMPYVSHNLGMGFRMVMWFPISNSRSMWAC